MLVIGYLKYLCVLGVLGGTKDTEQIFFLKKYLVSIKKHSRYNFILVLLLHYFFSCKNWFDTKQLTVDLSSEMATHQFVIPKNCLMESDSNRVLRILLGSGWYWRGWGVTGWS